MTVLVASLFSSLYHTEHATYWVGSSSAVSCKVCNRQVNWRLHTLHDTAQTDPSQCVTEYVQCDMDRSFRVEHSQLISIKKLIIFFFKNTMQQASKQLRQEAHLFDSLHCSVVTICYTKENIIFGWTCRKPLKNLQKSNWFLADFWLIMWLIMGGWVSLFFVYLWVKVVVFKVPSPFMTSCGTVLQVRGMLKIIIAPLGRRP